ncbi:hypothetical protein HL650_06605 [Blautia pseudococcoides]|uniref:hypothetical protein n=1 Tax=Blautia pseudococcoides TaxID=1796616 RepID=UPI00148B0076|nr:hypothetical protein [Blautia pseudococcoides]QJU14159.1 hypothetical protein HL650_06605 [Blautia pseudococcoides]
MAEDKDNTLLNDVKNYLDKTWDDSLGDKKLTGIIQRGMAAISGKIGECNFYEETQERALLFDYVMYVRVGETPQFWQNYKNEIISLQIERKVDAYAADQ